MKLPPVPREQPFLNTDIDGNKKPSMPWMFWFEKIASSVSISNPGGSLDQNFFAYDSNGLLYISNVDTALKFDTEIVNDNNYTITGDEDIEILSSGDYEIDVDGGFETDSGDMVRITLQRDIGAGYIDVPGSVSYANNVDN